VAYCRVKFELVVQLSGKKTNLRFVFWTVANQTISRVIFLEQHTEPDMR
jgi:hypothetical protein